MDRFYRALARKHKLSCVLDVKSERGKKLGSVSYWLKDDEPGTVYMNWIVLFPWARGKGYGSSVFQFSVDYLRGAGIRKLLLEVPGNSPEARYIYERAGFDVVSEPTQEEIDNDPVWGGLTQMVKFL